MRRSPTSRHRLGAAQVEYIVLGGVGLAAAVAIITAMSVAATSTYGAGSESLAGGDVNRGGPGGAPGGRALMGGGAPTGGGALTSGGGSFVQYTPGGSKSRSKPQNLVPLGTRDGNKALHTNGEAVPQGRGQGAIPGLAGNAF